MDELSTRLSKAASLMGDPSRAAMLWSLLGGESRPASELAMIANVSPQTASNHLKLLFNAGFVKVASMGRNKFYRLSGPSVASALESLAGAISAKTVPHGVAHQTAPDLVFARTCYDHLAGDLGVAILNRLLAKDCLQEHGRDYRLTGLGKGFFCGLNVDVLTIASQRRRFAYPCLDWSRRTPHLGGSLGAAMLDCLVRTGIVTRRKASRFIRVTDRGREQLYRLFAIRLARSGTAILNEELRVKRLA